VNIPRRSTREERESELMRLMLSGRAWFVSVLVIAAIGFSVPVFGQGFYYKEIEKDGRIYVFNNAARAELFEKSGEIGIGITKPGAGPNGETVIGDSERALQLYFFKHGIAEAVPEPTPPVQIITWSDGKTRITTNLAYLEISNRIQTRYTQEFPDDLSPILTGTAAAGDTRGSFRVRRAKFKLEGWFWRPPEVAPSPRTMPRLSYEVQLNWAAVAANVGAQPANVGAILEDANIAWDPQGMGKFRIVFGEYKVPFGRQQLTSSGNQQFVDRSLVADEYERGRDIGVSVQGAVWSNKLEYRLGVFNGNGLTRPSNDNDKFQYNARLMWQPNGNQVLAQRAWVSGALYSEGDFESTTVPLYAIALNFESNNFHRTTTGDDLKSTIVGIDGIYKFKGFSATGEYFLRKRTPEIAQKFDSNGGYLQAGMMLNQFRTWEAVARFGQREVSDLVANDDITEIRAGINYYYRRHSLKFQSDYGLVETGRGTTAGSRKDYELRMQAQFIF
jgi:phosphate-selective porin OprO/OprP